MALYEILPSVDGKPMMRITLRRFFKPLHTKQIKSSEPVPSDETSYKSFESALYVSSKWCVTFNTSSPFTKQDPETNIWAQNGVDNAEWRRLDNEKLHSLYCLHNIVRVITSRRLRREGRVAKWKEVGMLSKF